MMTDPIADMLTRIRNAQKSRKEKITIPFSNLKKNIIDILVKEGYLTSAEVVKDGNKTTIDLELKYLGREPVIRSIKRESKPGRRVYCKAEEIPTVLEGFGIAIISTPKGLLTNKEAKKEKVGGELICSVYKNFELSYMSRVGKKVIKIPSGVTVEFKGGLLKVKGPKGELARSVPSVISVSIDNGEVKVNVANPEEKREHALWGTYGAHIANMVEGVVNGFKKDLEINGVGFNVAMQGKDLKLAIGFSHPVIFKMPENVKATIEKNIIKLESIDIELLGQTAASIRGLKKPEPYKGKGIKYTDETIRRKAGKTATKAAA